MNEIFTPNTGDEKMDEAYMRLKNHMDSFDEFSKFYGYFFKVAKTDDPVKLNRWLLMVLFVVMKSKHPFDQLLDKANNKEALKQWLEDQLEKMEGK